jgi:uncharacterized protein
MEIERRQTLELRTTGRSKLAGYAAVFGALSEDLGGFTETIRPGAFRRSLATKPDVLALFDHDARLVLGRTTSGTLQLKEDAKGLGFEIDVPETQTGKDLLVSVGRGDIRGASFSFRVVEDRWTQGNSGMVRELLDVDLLDVTITAHPAYPDTEVARRALDLMAKPMRAGFATRYLEIMAGPK